MAAKFDDPFTPERVAAVREMVRIMQIEMSVDQIAAAGGEEVCKEFDRALQCFFTTGAGPRP